MNEKSNWWYVINMTNGDVSVWGIPPTNIPNYMVAIAMEDVTTDLPENSGHGRLKAKINDSGKWEFYYQYPEPDKETLQQQRMAALEAQNTFLEDCIAEMAAIVYDFDPNMGP